MSLDNVELTFDAAICIRVVDAQKAVLMLTTGLNDIISELYANVQARAYVAQPCTVTEITLRFCSSQLRFLS